MKTKLTTKYIQAVTADKTKVTRHWDTEIRGFLLQVSARGVMTWYYRYLLNGKNKTYKIGRYPNTTATQARSMAKTKAGDVEAGIDIQQEKKTAKHNADIEKKTTLRGYIDNVYSDYLKTEKKTGDKMLQTIEANFSQWDKKQLTGINTFLVGNWRKVLLKNGRSAGGINRPIAYLRALLNHAYRHAKVIDHHPLATFKQLREDKSKVVRYLSESEKNGLHDAMVSRDTQARLKRESSNQWHKDRGYKLLPEIQLNGYSDYLTPMVLLALNTGMRRGELFNLHWWDIDFKAKTLAVHGSGAKSGKTRHIPLNKDTLGVLIKWRDQTTSKCYVFTGKNGKLTDVKTAFNNLLKDAGITDFRFHDLRHDFASKLAVEKVDLNTIRELLGHSDLQMTMRYAHLSPNVKAEAVEALCK